jgi:predicted amidohydrolase YtcJ
VFVIVFALAALAPSAQAPAPDLILTNGKIITVDERFTIAQAVAIRGDRFIAVGSDQAIGKLAGPSTRRIDLRGKAVIPGLIDNHMHLLRAGTTWQYEVRWDGVASRAEALERLRARAKTVAAGEWIYTLGGWTIEQFADDSRPFTRGRARSCRARSSAAASGVLLQDLSEQPCAADARHRHTRQESSTKPACARLRRELPVASGDRLEASTRLMISDLNKAGLTSFGSAGCETDVLPVYRKLADQGQLNVRVFCITGAAAANPQQVDRVVAQVPSMKLFQGDRFIDHVFYGESVYGPLHDPMFVPTTNPQPDELAQWRRIATEIAKAGCRCTCTPT